MARVRVTVSLKKEVFNKLESERKKKKLSAYFNDFFEKHFGIKIKK